ncbi:MAG: LysR family transcriptional regulator [Vulcanimicrobiota bacterium]
MATTIHEMEILVAVVKAGSFTAAAKTLGLPKSSLSRRLTGLEQRLGVRLLHRSTRSLRLTTVGETYFDRALRVLVDIEDLESQVSGFAKTPRGLLRVTCPAGLPNQTRALFAAFLETYPEVRLQLEETDRVVDLVAEGFDLALRGGRPPDPTLQGMRVGGSPSVLVASPAYLKRRSRPTNLKSLHEHALLSLSHRPWRLKSARRELEVAITPRLVTNNLAGLTSLTEKGLGVALLPGGNCREPIAQGRLARVLPAWSGPRAEFWVVYPSQRGMTSAVRAFLELVKSWDFDGPL